jgi:enamine deaminase RidA (YjgF/YER057c/UK114 family)
LPAIGIGIGINRQIKRTRKGKRMDFLQPPGWARARGYSNGISASGRTVVVSGMIGWDAECRFQTTDFAGQVRQALQNIVAVLAEAQARPEHIVRMTWYVIDKQEYIKAYKDIGDAYREIMGRHYPTMTAVQVVALIEDEARVEIEVTAIVPE